MKVCLTRYIRGTAYHEIEVDEKLLEEVNDLLASDYVMFEDVSQVPQIPSIEELEGILRGLVEDVTVLYNAYIDKKYEERFSDSLNEVIYEIVGDMVFDAEYDLIDCDTVDRYIEFIKE